jgi:hypothetical protein
MCDSRTCLLRSRLRESPGSIRSFTQEGSCSSSSMLASISMTAIMDGCGVYDMGRDCLTAVEACIRETASCCGPALAARAAMSALSSLCHGYDCDCMARRC